MFNDMGKLVEQRKVLLKQLRSMHAAVSHLLESRQVSERASISPARFLQMCTMRYRTQQRQLLELKDQLQHYEGVLSGKYPSAVAQELDKAKQLRTNLKKQINLLQKQLKCPSDPVLEVPEHLLKEEYALKVQHEELRSKNQKRQGEIQTINEKLESIRIQLPEMNLKESKLSREYYEATTIDGRMLWSQAQLAQNKQKIESLQIKRAKLSHQIERKNNLKASQLARKLSKLQEVNVVAKESVQMHTELDLQIEQSLNILETLRRQLQQQKHKKQTSKLNQNLANLYRKRVATESQAYQNTYRLRDIRPPAYFQTRENKVLSQATKGRESRTKVASLLQQEYPDQYKDLFLQAPEITLPSITPTPKTSSYLRPLKHQRILGQRVRI